MFGHNGSRLVPKYLGAVMAPHLNCHGLSISCCSESGWNGLKIFIVCQCMVLPWILYVDTPVRKHVLVCWQLPMCQCTSLLCYLVNLCCTALSGQSVSAFPSFPPSS